MRMQQRRRRFPALPHRNDSGSLPAAGRRGPPRFCSRSNAAQICGSHRTSAIDDLIAEPQQALVGAGSCFVGVGSVWHLIAAALFLFLKRESQVDLAADYRFDVIASKISASTPVDALSLSAHTGTLTPAAQLLVAARRQVLAVAGRVPLTVSSPRGALE